MNKPKPKDDEARVKKSVLYRDSVGDTKQLTLVGVLLPPSIGSVLVLAVASALIKSFVLSYGISVFVYGLLTFMWVEYNIRWVQ